MGGFSTSPVINAPPTARPLEFIHFIILDEDGAYLCGFDETFSPVPARHAPPTLLQQAHHIATSGRLPPRSRILSAAGWASLLSISGDLVTAHVSFPQEPGPFEIRAAFAALLAFETACGLHLDELRGDSARLMNVRGNLWKALRNPPAELPLPDLPSVYLHCKMGVKGGHITAELHLHNETSAPVEAVKVTYESARDFLRPVAIYGYDAEVSGHDIRLLHGLDTGERVILLHFEPQEARPGALRTTLEYVDARGDLVVRPARQQRVTVEAPPMVPAEPRSTDELVRLISGDDLIHDAWRFSWPGVVSEAFAFARLKEAVERERPLRLFEIELDRPQYYEAWYVAEVAKVHRPVVIEVSAWGDNRLLDIRVATSRQADVVGALAAYRRRVYELLSERFMGVRAPPSARAVPPGERGAPSPALNSALLVRHLMGKLGESELAYALRRQAAWDREVTVDLVTEFEDALAGAAPRSSPRTFSHATEQRPKAASGDDFELLPGLLQGYRRLIAPEIRARAAALEALRT